MKNLRERDGATFSVSIARPVTEHRVATELEYKDACKGQKTVRKNVQESGNAGSGLDDALLFVPAAAHARLDSACPPSHG